MNRKAAAPKALSPSLQFLGATGTVTGSKFLVRTGGSSVLVDCGLFQGLAPLRRRNWQPPAADLSIVDGVVLTHAHLDHCGYLPVLARGGWRGPVYATEGTAELAAIVLRDSAHLMEEEAEHANRYGWSKHKVALPLYDAKDAELAIQCLTVVPHGERVRLADGIELTYGSGGHILGSAWARLDLGDGGDGGDPARTRTVVFSGDLGRQEHRLLRPPEPRPPCDALVLESTYGARDTHEEDVLGRLTAIVGDTLARGGNILIPAFAVDRTEVILAALATLMRDGRIEQVPVLVDSPMALASLRVYRTAIAERWPEIRPGVAEGPDPFAMPGLRELHTVEESMRANHPRLPSIVISASGMATGGRILHHLEHLLPDDRNTVLIVGFAAAGTRARQLVSGARAIKIHGRYVPVRAQVHALDGFSAHADAGELVAWATDGTPVDTTYLVHGEPDASEAVAARLAGDFGWNAVVPRDGERVLL